MLELLSLTLVAVNFRYLSVVTIWSPSFRGAASAVLSTMLSSPPSSVTRK